MWEPFHLAWGSPPPGRMTSPKTGLPPFDAMETNSTSLFRLQWNDHVHNMSKYIREQLPSIRTNSSFSNNSTKNYNGNSDSKSSSSRQSHTDCALIFDDGVTLEVHRILLAASSPYFLNIFATSCSQSSDQILIMNEVRSEDMKLLLDFIYLGEVAVHQDQLDRLIALGNSLQIKGLSGKLTERIRADAIEINKNTDKSPSDSRNEEIFPGGLNPVKRLQFEYEAKVDDKHNVASACSDRTQTNTETDSEISNKLQFVNSLKEKLCSRSSTPLSRNSSPYSEMEPNKKHLRDQENDTAYRKRSRSPPSAAHSSAEQYASARRYVPEMISPKNLTMSSVPANFIPDNLHTMIRRDCSPPPIRHLIHPTPLGFTPRLDHNEFNLNSFINLPSNINHPPIAKPQPSPPTSDEDRSPPPPPENDPSSHHPGMPPAISSAMTFPIPHLTDSPSCSPNSKRQKFGPSMIPANMPSLITPTHPQYMTQLNNLNLRLNPGDTAALPANDMDYFRPKYMPEVPGVLGQLSVKKDLGALEDQDVGLMADRARKKRQPNGPLPPYLTPSDYRSPLDYHQLSKHGLDSPARPEDAPCNHTANRYSPLFMTYLKNKALGTNHHSTSSSNPIRDLQNSNREKEQRQQQLGTTTPAAATSNASSNSDEPSNISDSTTNSTTNPGVNSKIIYNNSFVNADFTGNSKPEWKRYKQYSKDDLLEAIEEVKNGMTALQASRKYKVPSRTLYDKIKKLGVSTSLRRVTSSGGKLRSTSLGLNNNKSSDMNHGMGHFDDVKVDVEELSAVVCSSGRSSSGGVLLSDAAVDSDSHISNGITSGGNMSESNLVSTTSGNHSDSRYEPFRPKSEDSNATNDSHQAHHLPLDLQIPKSISALNEASSDCKPSVNYDPKLYSIPNLQSTALGRTGDRRYPLPGYYPHSQFFSKQILDMLPQHGNHLSDQHANESIMSTLANFRELHASEPFAYNNNLFNPLNMVDSILNKDEKFNEEFLKNNIEMHPSLTREFQQRVAAASGSSNSIKSEDDDVELIVDNDEHLDNKSDDQKAPEAITKSAEAGEYNRNSPYLTKPSGVDANSIENAYVSPSAGPNEPSSSDSPPGSSFTTADSGHYSNNDTSATSDIEARNQATDLSVKLPQESPEARNTTSSASISSEVSPKASDISSTSGSEVSPILSEKRATDICVVDSDNEVNDEKQDILKSSGKYNVVSDLGICSVRALDLREPGAAMSIPQRSA